MAFQRAILPAVLSWADKLVMIGKYWNTYLIHCEIVVDAEKMKREEKAYKPIPVITDFADANGNDCMKEMVKANYRRIKEEVKQIVADELERIAGDENLKHLLQQK